jgi:3-deoxy-manno-octulosonate cytidylyltransferase (CMP-KDO synthetase)
LALIDGRTMVEHVHRRAESASSVDAVLVATDDDRIARVVDAFGGTAVMTNADHASGTDRLAEVADVLQAEVVVNVQGDEPLMSAEAIDAAVSLVLGRPENVIGTLRRRIDDMRELYAPQIVKVVVDREGYALYFTRAAVPFMLPDREHPPLWRHVGLYAYRRSMLKTLANLPQTPLEKAEGLEQLRALENGIRIRTVETTADTIGVDTPEDLERVRRLVEGGVRS